MIKVLTNFAHRSVRHLTRVAAVFALFGLGIMALSIVWPRPLVVILAMSAGHVLGALAIAFYLLAIIIDATRRAPSTGAVPLSAAAPPPDASMPAAPGAEGGPVGP